MDEKYFSTMSDDMIVARFYDWMMISANFTAPVFNAARFLPTEQLKPVQTAPGVTTITLMAMAYRKIDSLSPYNEFGVLLPVTYEQETESNSPTYFVITLPVTTPEARGAGVMLYGYPKFVADITFEHDETVSRCYVQADGQAIVSLAVEHVQTSPQTFDLCTYTVKDGRLLKTRIQIQGQVGSSSSMGGAKHELGDHPVAEKLRALGMSAASTEHQYAPQLQSILPLAEEVGAVKLFPTA